VSRYNNPDSTNYWQAQVDQLPSAEQVAEVFRNVLAHQDFIELEGRESFWDVLWGWIGPWITAFFRWLNGLGGDSPWPALAALIGTLLVAWAIFHLASRHAPKLKRRVMEIDPHVAGHRATARDWLEVSALEARAGAFRPAATALYQGWILNLDGDGMLAFHDSKTPGDYLVEFPNGRRFLDSFQLFAFGKSERTAEGYENLLNLARQSGCPIDASDGSPE